MTFKIKGFTDTEPIATHVDAWYDRHTRLWVIQKLTDEGYQVGDAVYVYGKADAMETKKQMEEELK